MQIAVFNNGAGGIRQRHGDVTHFTSHSFDDKVKIRAQSIHARIYGLFVALGLMPQDRPACVIEHRHTAPSAERRVEIGAVFRRQRVDFRFLATGIDGETRTVLTLLQKFALMLGSIPFAERARDGFAAHARAHTRTIFEILDDLGPGGFACHDN